MKGCPRITNLLFVDDSIYFAELHFRIIIRFRFCPSNMRWLLVSRLIGLKHRFVFDKIQQLICGRVFWGCSRWIMLLFSFFLMSPNLLMPIGVIEYTGCIQEKTPCWMYPARWIAIYLSAVQRDGSSISSKIKCERNYKIHPYLSYEFF